MIQVRPIKRPSYWPQKNGGWATVHKDGSGWSDGENVSAAIPMPNGYPSGATLIRVATVLLGWLQDMGDESGGGWEYRVIDIELPSKRRKRKA